MRNTLKMTMFALLAGAFMPLPIGSAAAAEASETKAARYSVDATKVGTLLDDPAAVEILKRLVPSLYANEMFQTMGRDQTLKVIQQYEPGPLSEENLAKIQAEFDKLPAKG